MRNYGFMTKADLALTAKLDMAGLKPELELQLK